MAELHLYEFECGTYAAGTKEEAIGYYEKDSGADGAEDFTRAIPDDEEIEITMEMGEKWGDPRAYAKPVGKVRTVEIWNHAGMRYKADAFLAVWCLKLTAKEWAHRHPDPGYRFGDEP